ncbi:hypothetical protein [Vibrio sp. F74]|uniref:hypothetical protein n=1 Tax=Vibrio sp. F74 TaxID=700020 RepID=UPI0035F5F94A
MTKKKANKTYSLKELMENTDFEAQRNDPMLKSWLDENAEAVRRINTDIFHKGTPNEDLTSF